MFMNKIVIGTVSAALLVSGPGQAVAQTTTDTAVATVNVAQGMQKITYSDNPFVAPEQGLTGRAFVTRWDAIQAEAQESGVDGSLCDTDTRERTANVVVSIGDRKSTRLNSSHVSISYAVFCLKKKRQQH